jgi:hypothetical protein
MRIISTDWICELDETNADVTVTTVSQENSFNELEEWVTYQKNFLLTLSDLDSCGAVHPKFRNGAQGVRSIGKQYYTWGRKLAVI